MQVMSGNDQADSVRQTTQQSTLNGSVIECTTGLRLSCVGVAFARAKVRAVHNSTALLHSSHSTS